MLSIRTSNELREKLEGAVAHSGRTLTQEVEMRLERSFIRDEFTGSPQTSAFLDLLGAAIKEAEARLGGSWTADPDTWDEIAKLSRKLVNDRRPNSRKSQ
jgi:hypothetical protein